MAPSVSHHAFPSPVGLGVEQTRRQCWHVGSLSIPLRQGMAILIDLGVIIHLAAGFGGSWLGFLSHICSRSKNYHPT